jgi:four helix bundle protein
MIDSENLIIRLTFNFSLKILEFCELLDEKKKWKLSDQILRAGTSIGANANEAQNAESRSDFIHKFKISAKEANETEYFLKLCQFSKTLPDCTELIEDLLHIQKIINQIISTSKNNKS